MKAIQTLYRDTQFRSRLEAQWAVFFDELSVTWLYEVNGYDLGGRDWYLPDFFIPCWDCFVEVKPFNPNEREARVARKLAEGSGKPVIVLCGQPALGKYYASVFRPDSSVREGGTFLGFRRGSGWLIAGQPVVDGDEWGGDRYWLTLPHPTRPVEDDGERCPDVDNNGLPRAYATAMSYFQIARQKDYLRQTGWLDVR